MKIIKLVFTVIIFSAFVFTISNCGGKSDQPAPNIVQGHVFDKAGIISASDKPRFEWLLDLIEKESDLDIKFLFLKSIKNATVEEVAVKKMAEFGIGRNGREERGVLFLYVMDEKKLRIEVGYGLEGYLPDIFVGYLIRNQADAFFKADNPSLGLRLLIRILQYRIREAILNKDYDPSILEGERRTGFGNLSGGAGAAESIGTSDTGQAFQQDHYDEEARKQFMASTTVQGTFSKYIDWLYGQKFDPNIDLFTKQSIQYLNRLQITPAYFDYMRMFIAGKKHEVVKRGDLAVLYSTDSPLATPLFFNRINGKWKINSIAEVRNSQNHVGGVYTWSFNPDSRDEFAKTFQDLLIQIRGYYRFKDGDNRQLPVKVDVQRQQ